MSVRRTQFAITAAVFAALCFTSTNAMAISRDHDETAGSRTRPGHAMTQHGAHAAHRQVRHDFREGAPVYRAVVVPAYRWPGYMYVPRKGIVDEACNLPTSACPNEMRDLQ